MQSVDRYFPLVRTVKAEAHSEVLNSVPKHAVSGAEAFYFWLSSLPTNLSDFYSSLCSQSLAQPGDKAGAY